MKIKEKLESYARTLKLSRKPDKDEFSTTLKICAIGIGLLGIIGFIFYVVSVFIG